MPHRIPLKELIDLVPPTRESAQFRYFEPWTGTAFDPARRTLTVAQAGWLMESALLAYSPPKPLAAVICAAAAPAAGAGKSTRQPLKVHSAGVS